MLQKGMGGLLDDLKNAMAQFEGFNVPGSRAQRNNNPGNLRAGAGQIGTDAAGYAIFPDLATGWAAFERQIRLDAGRGLTLAQFIGKYAPPSENDTQGYLGFVTSRLGVSPGTSLSELISGAPPGGAAQNPTPGSRPSAGGQKAKREEGPRRG